MKQSHQRGIKSVKGLEATKTLYPILKQEYLTAYQGKQEGKPVAWVTVYFPVEIVHAMGIVPVFPENYAALCAAKQRTAELCQAAEREGYSKDLCSYFRSSMGTVLLRDSVLSHEIPAPDILLTTTSLCDVHLKWFESMAKVFNCPLFVLDVPYNTACGDATQVEFSHVENYVNQLEDLVVVLEKVTKTPLDRTKLYETIRLSDRASELWLEVQNLRRSTPCPMSAEDAFSNIALLITQAGTTVATDFFTRLRDEVKLRVEQGMGVIPEERYRLIWDMVPMWYSMGLFNYLQTKGAVVVAEYFNQTWPCRLNPDQPLETLARKYIAAAWGNSPLDRKFDRFAQMVKEYQADGVIMFSNWGCRAYCIGQLELKKVLQSQSNIPSLIIDGDIADPRSYAEAQLLTRVDAFIESLG